MIRSLRLPLPPLFVSCSLSRLIRFLLPAVFVCAVGPMPTSFSAEPDNGQAFSVMTWNLEWFYDENSEDNFSKLAKEKSAPTRELWNWRRDAIAASIARVSPSIVAFQEVENRRVLWYLSRTLDREHKQSYRELCIESGDHFTEQDVGYLFRSPVDVLSISQQMLTRAMKSTEKFYQLSKHLVAVFRVPAGEGFETVTMLNLHLRSGAEGESIRKRQALLVHRWIEDAVSRGENVIVLGDFNTEEKGNHTMRGSDIGIMAGFETKTADDNLIDLTLRVPASQRKTHLLGKQFDRILVSRSLLADDPSRPDLVFDSIEVRPDLAIRGGQDGRTEHWDRYWEMPAEKRDLSDHYPVIATFKIK